MAQVLVTGGSGYVAAHCIVKALDAGHMVQTSLRSLRRADEVRAAVLAGGVDPDHLARLTFCEADLKGDEGWSEATKGCDYVLHVASPFPATPPPDPQDLILPARDGALRVLRASVEQGVERVVLTSSFAAVGYGHEVAGRPFDERDWTDIAGPDVNPYIQSKTIAERAAWDFMRSHGRDSALCVINPTGIFGPTLSRNLSASVDLIRQLMAGEMAAAPRSYFGVVDVRDVADLHLLAMTAEGAAGQRLLATTEPQESLLSVARMIGQSFPSLKDRLPTREIADHSSDLASSVSTRRPASAAKARALGWSPRSSAETIVDTAKSLIEHAIVALPHIPDD
jgi:dihydroflavonol-4-reductase